MSDEFGPPNCNKCGYAHWPTLDCQSQSELSAPAGSGTVNEQSVRDLRRALLAVAKLAAKTPKFCNPMDAWEARNIRDFVLYHAHRFCPPNEKAD